MLQQIKKYFCKEDLFWSITLSLIIPIWMGIDTEWYSWYNVKGNGIWTKQLYYLLDSQPYINIPICIALSYITHLWCQRIIKDQYFRLFRPILPCIGLFFLWSENNHLIYAKVIWELDYKLFFTCFLLCPLWIISIKLLATISLILKAIKKKEDNTNKYLGFSYDDVNDTDIPESLKKYSSTIVDRLLATNTHKHSFAVGIIGEWGVGKTKFLELLISGLENKVEIVKFNPWLCRTPEQVTQDFFTSLRHQLSSKYSPLSKSIKEYAKSVNNITFVPQSALSLGMNVFMENESLDEKKQVLSEKFSNLPHPVVVVIDDIDRLEREEVFEVLRLIRNTADLRNIIYLVAYDKEYVTYVLEEKDIKNASSYLEKIFPLEIHLPKVENFLIWQTLQTDIRLQDCYKGDFTNFLFKNFSSNDYELIICILNNYRRAKRFARLYTLNIHYLKSESYGELSLLDFFWLELLQMYDKPIYDLLSDNPNSLLYCEKERINIQKGISEQPSKDDKHAYKGKRMWKEHTPKILERLFGTGIRTTSKSICFIENYSKYFTLSISPYKLSISELKQLFDDNRSPDDVVNTWVKNHKYINSIIYQFKHIDVKELQENKLSNYLHGLLCLGIMSENTQYGIKELLREERYSPNSKNKANKIILSWMEEKVNDEEKLQSLSKLLNTLYVTDISEEMLEAEVTYSLIISNEEVKKLLMKVMTKFLIKHSEVTALDVINEKSTLGQIFRNCCITATDAPFEQEYKYEQVSFGIVINHFAAKRKKPTVKEYDEAIKKMFSEETYNNNYGEEDYYNYIENSIEQKYKSYFGSSYNTNLYKFKTRCFITDKKVDTP